ncbi:MAG: exopolysaccharide biosynthesis polyprenyl glycosylphosphotransferase, partial [candidate division Zixibacteria bacterium]|nr:exopolysaccharide biosynthesis polyprenyl glycosylphosphotransferase [candidate division Zixibacteria bacterium]
RTAVVVYHRLDQFALIREAFRDVFERVVLIDGSTAAIDLGGVNVRQYGDLLTFEVRHTLVDRAAQFQKRVIDVLVSGAGLLALSPMLLLTALAIALDSPGGVFYRQRRIGKGGREFGMLKFRTMRRDADAVLQQLLDSDPAAQREWQTYQKLQRDPRITRVGRLLRRFSLDELPQLWNVLIGEMSIVGPRPIMLNQQQMYGPNFRHYIRVVPGITGLWQISGRNRTSFAQRTAFDAEYINNWTIWSDIYILVRTAWVVLRRDGAC